MKTTTIIILVAGFLLQTAVIQGLWLSFNANIHNIYFSSTTRRHCWNSHQKRKLQNFSTSTQCFFADVILKKCRSINCFCTNDAAFAKLPPELLQRLFRPESHFELADILEYHIVPQNLTVEAISKLNPPVRLETVVGRGLFVTKNGDQLKIDNANVVTSDVFATNGIIHIIDEVLFPHPHRSA